ncbi:hypothetical protein [Neolewinella agarilytica]|uniref:hypothetical protein n=1 Tax=Neolewinella agarilytica TaxID=478744 RepID=UPI002356CDC9|nr:hypothetical protein [Neolewinella agarilytica]
MKHLPLLLLITLALFTSCANRGHYTVMGSFNKVQLPFAGKKIGVLEPRGVFGDEAAQREVDLGMKKLGKCPETTVFTEEQLNRTDRLPAIFGEGLSDSHIQYFTENTDLDYLIYIDAGPGRADAGTGQPLGFGADREAHSRLFVFDLGDGSEIKSITVNGTLNITEDKKWYQYDYGEPSIGRRALQKGLKYLVKYSDCR